MEIGRIFGETSPKCVQFILSEETRKKGLQKGEFVMIRNGYIGKDVLGKVREIGMSNELLPRELIKDSGGIRALEEFNFGLEDGESLVALADILGYEEDGKLKQLRYPFKPGEPVHMAESRWLEKLLNIDKQSAVNVGRLLVRPDVQINMDLNKIVNKHMAILAATGAGKSVCCAMVLEEIIKKNGAAIVMDPHGEYESLRWKDKKRGLASRFHDNVKVFGPSDTECDFTLSFKVSDLSDEDFAAFIELTEPQKDLLVEVIRNASGKYGENYDIDELCGCVDDIMRSQDEGSQKKYGKGTAGVLQRKLERLKNTGVFGDMRLRLEDLVRRGRVSVINLSGLPSGIQQVIVAGISKRILDARINQKRNREASEKLDIPVLLVLEEAHNFVPHEEIMVCSPAIRKIAREGRKFGVGLILISQRPGKLDSDCLSQCNTMIIMRIINPQDQDNIRQSAEAITEDIIEDLPGLGVGEAVLIGEGVKLPMMISIKNRETEHGGSDIDIVGEWSREPDTRERIDKKELAKKF